MEEFSGMILSLDIDVGGHYLSYSVLRSLFDPIGKDYKIWVDTNIYDLHLDLEVCSIENGGEVFFTPQNQLLIFRSKYYTFLILNPDNCSVVNQFTLDINTYRDIDKPSFTISPDGKLLVVMAGGKIQIIDMNNGELIHEVAVDLIGDEPLQIVDFSPDGKFIVGARNKNYEDVKGHILLFGVREK